MYEVYWLLDKLKSDSTVFKQTGEICKTLTESKKELNLAKLLEQKVNLQLTAVKCESCPETLPNQVIQVINVCYS